MKLLIATPLYPPEIGGPATYAKLLLEGLPANGVEVELVKFSEVRHLPRLIRHYVYYRRVLQATKRADIVLALDPVSVGLPALLAARRAKKPFVVKVVGDYAWEQGQQRFGVSEPLESFVKTYQPSAQVRTLQRIEAYVAAGAARVIVPSEYLKSIVGAWGIKEEKIEVIYNAVSLGTTGRIPEGVEKLPRPLVASVGRLVPWKHVEGVVDAVGGVLGASLAIVGTGPLEQEIGEKAKEVLPDRAVLTGTLSHEDTLAVMKAADVLVLNSSYEGMSHLLIEALMLGTPVIATNVGGNPEVITHEQDGLLISPQDPHALANALARLLNEKDLRTQLSTHARESSKRFSVETMLTKTSELLKSL